MTLEDVQNKIYDLHGSVKETSANLISLDRRISDHIDNYAIRDKKVDDMLQDISDQLNSLQSLKITVATVASGVSVVCTVMVGTLWDILKRHIL